MEKRKQSPYLECGQIINTHGCRGGVKVDPWMDSPDDLCGLERVFLGTGEEKRAYAVTRASVMQGRFVLLELEGVNDMDAADALRGQTVYAARDDFELEEGQYFLSDAVGLPVLDVREGREGQTLGTVEDILPGAAAPVFSVRTAHGTVLVPGVPAFIKEVTPGECVRMEPIDGMFDDDAVILPPDPGEQTAESAPAARKKPRRGGKKA